MEIAVGVDLAYRVYLHRGRIRHDGRWCVGWCDHDRHVLLIADTLDMIDRAGVLCHEFWHAFEHAFGHFAYDGASRADLFAMGTRQFHQAVDGNPQQFVARLDYQAYAEPTAAWAWRRTLALGAPARGEATLCDIS